MFTRAPERSTRPALDPQRCLECPMCHTAISAESIAGVCSSCPLYHMKNGCCIDLIACPQCGYHSLPQEHPPRLSGPAPQQPEHTPAPNAPTLRPRHHTMPPGEAPRPQAERTVQPEPDPRARDSSAAPCSGAVRLSDVRAGTRARLLGFNGIDDNHLGRLTAYGLLPGVNIEVLQRFPAIILGVYQAELALETKLAEGIWVLPN